jgi:hypothetical protein
MQRHHPPPQRLQQRAMHVPQLHGAAAWAMVQVLENGCGNWLLTSPERAGSALYAPCKGALTPSAGSEPA